MRKIISLSIFLILFSFHTSIVKAQLSGTVYVGTGQTYTSLTGYLGLFDVIDDNGLSGNVTVYITSNLTEDGSHTLWQWTEYGGSGYTLTIKPYSATVYLISGNPYLTLINFYGCDRVTINGSYNGSGKYLRFRQQNNAYCCISFQNGACNNTITNCYIEGCNTNSTPTVNTGTIIFAGTTNTTGNNNNTISNCDIRDRSDQSNQTSAYAIYSYGNTTYPNTSNSITNNNIYNFWKDRSFGGGIYLTTGTGNNWSITGNSFYQVSTISPTGSDAGWNVITLNSSSINGCTISNNYIGGTSSQCGGNAWTVNSTNASFEFVGIKCFCGSSTITNVEGNTIANISLTQTPSSSTQGGSPFTGIFLQTGSVNVGDVTGNIIGSSTGTGSISITNSGTYSSAQTIRGIDHRTLGTVQNNFVGSITISGTMTGNTNFDAIAFMGTASSFTASYNVIGSTSTANSIQCASTLKGIMNGINSSLSGSTAIINNNIIANITNNSTNASAILNGIYHSGTAGATINSNSINNFNCAATPTSTTAPGTAAITGIICLSATTGQSISGNTINTLLGSTTGAYNTNVTGICISSNSSTSTGNLTKNRIYDLNNTSTGSSPAIFGINAYYSSWNVYNNQITITNGQATYNVQKSLNSNPVSNVVVNEQHPLYRNIPKIINNTVSENSPNGTVDAVEITDVIKKEPPQHDNANSTNGMMIQGIHDESGNTWNYYYNSVYIGGSAVSGNANSYAFVRQNNATTLNILNNLFFNARTGGTGNHYAIANEYTSPATGWSSTASNYNSLIASNASTIGEWGSGTNNTISQWRTNSGGDNSSWSSNSVSQTNLFTSISTGNLNINTNAVEAWHLHGKAVQISTINNDYNGNSRSTQVSTGAPTIGSNEFVPTSTPIAATQSGSLSPKGTTTYTFANGNIATIYWYTNGTLPTSVNIYYYSGTNPPNSVTGALYSNAYWSVVPTGGSGYSFDITFYYNTAVLGTISTENNIRLASSSDNGTNWQSYLTQGTGQYQYVLNTTNKTIKVYGLSSLSLFTLTDGNNPLPVNMSSFSSNLTGRDVNLSWVTTHEINNQGFAVERRYNNNTGYNDWVQIAFIQGHGTVNTQQSYGFTDKKLEYGKYQYRLKQTDYNGNYEYFSLNTPAEITIGNPLNFDMYQNYPNPSNPNTKIDFQVPFDSKITLKVYDITGKEVTELVNRTMQAGYYTTELNAINLASGVYFYRIYATGNGQVFTKTMKLLIIK